MGLRRLLWAVGLTSCCLHASIHSGQAKQTFTIFLDPEHTDEAIQVPSSFVGLSIEPALTTSDGTLGIQQYAKDPVFRQLLKNLAAYQTGRLIVRWGGHTQDEFNGTYPGEVWDSLAQLYTALGQKVQFTLPINWKLGDYQAAQLQLASAFNALGGDNMEAVYAINLGNEPDNYRAQSASNNDQAVQDYMAANYWGKLVPFIQRLRETVSTWSGGSLKYFAGPAVSSMDAFEPGNMTDLAAVGADEQGGPFFKVATIHMNGLSSRNMTPEAASSAMLDNAATIDRLRKMATPYASFVAHQLDGRIQFRVDQLSSIAGAGLREASDTMAGALFVVRASLTLMQAGVSGVNFHSTGCAPNGPILLPSTCVDPYYVVGNDDSVFSDSCPNSCGQADAPAEVNAPYYGLWFMQKLLRHHKTLKLLPADAVLPDSRNTNDLVSVYVLQNTHALRVVIVNTNAATDEEGSGDETITIVLKGSEDSPHDWGYGTLTHLMGDSGLDSTEDHMTLGGQHINPEHGTIEYNHYTCKVDREVDNVDNTISYTFVVSEGSAAILVVPDTRRLQSTKTAAWLQDGLPETVSKCPVH